MGTELNLSKGIAALVSRRYLLTDRLLKSGRDRWAHPSRAGAGCGPSCRQVGETVLGFEETSKGIVIIVRNSGHY
jgi:hypothetical protein